MTDSNPRAVVEQLYRHLEAGRMDEYIAQFAEDTIWIEPAGSVFGGIYRSPESVRELMTTATEEWWEEFSVDVDRLVVDGSTVIAITTTCGTAAETGRRMEARAAHLYVVENGLITKMESFEDTARVNSVIDGRPSPPPDPDGPPDRNGSVE